MVAGLAFLGHRGLRRLRRLGRRGRLGRHGFFFLATTGEGRQPDYTNSGDRAGPQEIPS